MGSVDATRRQSVEGRGAPTAQEHKGDRKIVMDSLLCTEYTAVWRHIMLYHLIRSESIMVATVRTLLIIHKYSTNEEILLEKQKAGT